MTTIDQRIIDALNDAGIDYDNDSFATQASFRDNGMDSLDVMSLLLAIEEKHGVKFSTDESTAITSPSELSLALDKKLS